MAEVLKGIVRDARGLDPEIQTLGGKVRVRVEEGTPRRDAVEALRRLADTLDDVGTWREVMGDDQ